MHSQWNACISFPASRYRHKNSRIETHTDVGVKIHIVLDEEISLASSAVVYQIVLNKETSEFRVLYLSPCIVQSESSLLHCLAGPRRSAARHFRFESVANFCRHLDRLHFSTPSASPTSALFSCNSSDGNATCTVFQVSLKAPSMIPTCINQVTQKHRYRLDHLGGWHKQTITRRAQRSLDKRIALL